MVYNFAIMLKLLVIAFPLVTWTSPQSSDKPTETGHGAETSQPDQRGTETSPLVVNEHAIQSDKEAAEEAQKDAKQDHVNSVNITLATVIAICAGLQFCGIVAQAFIYYRQTDLLNRTLREIHAQNRNATSRERGRLSIYFPDPKPMTLQTDSHFFGEVIAWVQNTGTTPAFDVYCNYHAFACNAEEAPPFSNIYGAGITSMIEGGKEYRVLDTLKIQPMFNGESPAKTFYVFIRMELKYNDVFQKRQRIARFMVRRPFSVLEYDRAISTDDEWMLWGGEKETYEIYAQRKARIQIRTLPRL